MLSDPVCGKRMQRVKAHAIVEYEGIAYLLCCPRCQAEFERAPKTYVSGARTSCTIFKVWLNSEKAQDIVDVCQ